MFCFRLPPRLGASVMALGLVAACQPATGQALQPGGSPAPQASPPSPGAAGASPAPGPGASPPEGTEAPRFGPFPSAPPLEAGFKGWELYAWREAGAWRFSLVPGTNATKAWAQVTQPGPEGVGLSLEAMMAHLARLPQGAQVFWLAVPSDRPAGADPSLPLKEHQALLQALAKALKVELTLALPSPSPGP